MTLVSEATRHKNAFKTIRRVYIGERHYGVSSRSDLKDKNGVITPEEDIDPGFDVDKQLTKLKDSVVSGNGDKIVKKGVIKNNQLSYIPQKPLQKQPQIPRLAHNLSRVLFEPNVFHQLQDIRSRVYNFTPFLQRVTNIKDFDFNKIKGFIPSSRDKALLAMAKKNANKHETKYYSSTSSMTGLLSQLHFALSGCRLPNFSGFSGYYKDLTATQMKFTPGARTASSVILSLQDSKNGIYSIDSDKSTDDSSVLSIMGNLMEVLLVTPEDEYSNYLNTKDAKSQEPTSDAYHYAQIGKFLVRSQLDAQDPRLPNTGVFDLKTRAVCAIRHDMNYVQNSQNNRHGYQITKRLGGYESYEKEKYDLIRSAMLKYSFQARIGNMDGIFVCYHNIEKIFGFEYIPLSDIDNFFHSNSESSEPVVEDPKLLNSSDLHYNLSNYVAENEFKFSFKVLEEIFAEILQRFDKQSFKYYRVVMKTSGVSSSKDYQLNVLFVPLKQSTFEKIQNQNSFTNEIKLARSLQKAGLLKDLDLKNVETDRNVFIQLTLNSLMNKARSKLRRAEFEQTLFETSSSVKGFKLQFSHRFDGGNLQTGRSAYPPSKKTKWELNYVITEMDDTYAQSMYKKLLKEKASMAWSNIVSERALLLREYGKLGRNREKYFSKMDEKKGVVVWAPDK